MSGAPNSQFAAPIAQAVNLLNQGQWAMAESVLTQVLRAAPQEPDALQLMGAIRANQGRTAEAEQLYRRSLALKPRQTNVQINLGKLLAMTGRVDEGIALLRGVVRAQPNNVDALVVLGQAQAEIGQTEFAEKNLCAALAKAPDDLTAALSLGSLLSETGRASQSETVLREALRKNPPPDMRAGLEHNLGVALKMQKQYGPAVAAFDTTLRLAPNLALAHYNRANTLVHMGRNEEAVEGYRRYLAIEPRNGAVHSELNALLYRMGRDAEFLKSFDAAGAARDALEPVKGGLLIRANRFDEALESFERSLARTPNDPELHNGKALALIGLDRLDEARAAYDVSLELRPEDVPTAANMACVLLRIGEEKRALTLVEEAVARAPLDQAALAVYELALRANRDARADVLADYERHVQVFDLAPPEGFVNMAAFNAALNSALDNLHVDAREHLDQTLRRGSQTVDPLFEGDDPLVAALRLRVKEAVAAYIARMDDSALHPMASRRTDRFHFTGSWSSRLRDQGFHTNHIHPMGWISSVYYVAVPDAVEDGQQGWLKFGEPSFVMPMNDVVRRMVKPVPGRLVLFPSYMWHGTVPFRSDTARTTIAFDAVPA